MSKYVHHLLFALIAFAFTFNVQATVLTTLNGTDYEWRTHFETRGISSSNMNLRLADPTDPFFGYEYASRALFEDLLLSYAPWDGLDGIHSNSAVTAGIQQFSSDFEAFAVGAANPTPANPIPTVDGGGVLFDSFSQFSGIYGAPGECGAEAGECLAGFDRFFKAGIVAASQKSAGGWDSTNPSPFTNGLIFGDPYVGSFLVREVPDVSPIPVPAAFWLFGTALIGLAGFGRRRKAA